jgi:nucleoside phosphorylase
VVAHLSGVKEHRVKGTVFEVGTFYGQHYVWTVAVAQVGSTGEKAAAHAERACAAFSPSYILFVGVAGGRKDVRRGDVVMADSVYDYQTGKEDEHGLRPRFKTHHSSHELVQRGQAVARRGRWQDDILPSSPLPSRPTAFVKPIAAGGRVIASDRAETAIIIAQHCGDAVAVETMSFSFLYGGHINPMVSAGVVCGISDLLSDKNEANDEQWQPIAASNAAAFTFAMLAETPINNGS